MDRFGKKISIFFGRDVDELKKVGALRDTKMQEIAQNRKRRESLSHW